MLQRATTGIGVARARLHLRSLLDLFDVASVDRSLLVAALDAVFDDVEDGMLPDLRTHARAPNTPHPVLGMWSTVTIETDSATPRNRCASGGP